MVSGLGTNFPKQRQIGFPNLLAIHIVPGPHGDGLQGSGFSMHLKCKSMLFGKKTEPNFMISLASIIFLSYGYTECFSSIYVLGRIFFL